MSRETRYRGQSRAIYKYCLLILGHLDSCTITLKYNLMIGDLIETAVLVDMVRREARQGMSISDKYIYIYIHIISFYLCLSLSHSQFFIDSFSGVWGLVVLAG